MYVAFLFYTLCQRILCVVDWDFLPIQLLRAGVGFVPDVGMAPPKVLRHARAPSLQISPSNNPRSATVSYHNNNYNVDREVADSLYPGHSMADSTGVFHVLWYNPCQNGQSVLHLQQLQA